MRTFWISFAAHMNQIHIIMRLFILAIPEDGVHEESEDEDDNPKAPDQRISSKD